MGNGDLCWEEQEGPGRMGALAADEWGKEETEETVKNHAAFDDLFYGIKL